MRTTVRLDPELLHEAKHLASDECTTFTALLEQALREMLARRRQASPRPAVSLPVFAGRGLQPGVDLDATAALLDLTERRDTNG